MFTKALELAQQLYTFVCPDKAILNDEQRATMKLECFRTAIAALCHEAAPVSMGGYERETAADMLLGWSGIERTKAEAGRVVETMIGATIEMISSMKRQYCQVPRPTTVEITKDMRELLEAQHRVVVNDLKGEWGGMTHWQSLYNLKLKVDQPEFRIY